MEIYVDVLLFLNLAVDFLLLSLTAKITGSQVALRRIILAAVTAAMFSLYIFLPDLGIFLSALLRLVASFVTTLVAFGFKTVKRFLRCLFCFYTVSFLYGGLMLAVWMMFKPRGMSVNNGVVYFDISPLVLIAVSLVFYVVIIAVGKLTKVGSKFSKRCDVRLYFGETVTVGKAMVDTGHTLTDAFGDSIMIIIDKTISFELFGDDVNNMMQLKEPKDVNIAKRFRLNIVKTVSGEKLLPCVKIDKADIESENKTYRLVKPIVVLTDAKIDDECSAIIPPEALLG